MEYHKISKTETSQAYDPKYNVGGYKTQTNVIGIINIIDNSKSEDIKDDMNELPSNHNNTVDC